MTGLAAGQAGGTGRRAGHSPDGTGVEFSQPVPELVDGSFQDPDGTPTDTIDISPIEFQEGDVMYVLLQGPASNGLETPPPGWVNARKPDTSGTYLYGRKMRGDESVVVLAETTTARATIAAVRNVDPDLPFGYFEESNSTSSILSLGTVTNISTSVNAYSTTILPEGYSMLMIGTNITDDPVTAYDNGGDPAYIPAADVESITYTNPATGKGGFVQIAPNAEKYPKGQRRMGATLGASTPAGVGVISIAIGAPRTSKWLQTPHVIDVGSLQGSSNSFAANLPRTENVRPGDLQVWHLGPWVWNLSSGGSGFDTVENAEIFGYEAVFASSPRALVAAVYDESHGDTYSITGPELPFNSYSRYEHWFRIVNHGGTLDTRTGGLWYDNNTVDPYPQPPVELQAEKNDLIVAAGFARAALNGTVMATNPDGFEQLNSGSQTSGGAGGSFGQVKLNVTETGLVTLPQLDHSTPGDDSSSASFGYMRVRPPQPAGVPVGSVGESVIVELDDVVVASVSSSTTVRAAKIDDDLLDPRLIEREVQLIAESESVVGGTAATVTDATATAEEPIVLIAESESVVGGTAATVTDDTGTTLA